MEKTHLYRECYHSKLGSSHTEKRVRQAVANATLEGLKPSKRSVDLIRAVASGSMSTNKALDALRGYYIRNLSTTAFIFFI